MAKNGTIRASINNSNWAELYWEEKSQSIANNTTTISWEVTLYGNRFQSSIQTCGVQIDGKYIFIGKVDIGSNGTGYNILASGDYVITHNSDGSKTFSCSFFQEINQTIAGYKITTLTGSDTFTLDKIPRAATITSAPNFTDEENPVLKYSNSAGTSASLQAAILLSDGSTSIAEYRTISNTRNSYTFNLTEAERNKIWQLSANSKSLTVRFYLKTTLGGRTYSTYTTKTLTIVNANPTISATVTNNSSEQIIALTGGDKLIKYYSSANVSTQATALKNATITSYKITCGSKNITTASGTFTEVESGDFVFSVVDSRGNIATQTITKDIIDYIKLTCNLDAKNPNAEGEMNFSVNGNYFNNSFGLVNNSLTIQYRYKENDGEFIDWIDVSPVNVSENTYSCDTTVTGLNYMNAYTFQARAIDKLVTIESSTSTVKAIPIFDWSENDFNFNVPVHFSKGATGIEFPVSLETGTWTPSVDNASITTSEGWYTKVGNVVTIGFYLRGTWNSNPGYTGLQISGLPFPSNSNLASGGGYLTGCNLLDGYVFCGWGITNSYNVIYGYGYRVNMTSTYEVSSFIVVSPRANTRFILSGTITYTTE